jgi:hypothetical protein
MTVVTILSLLAILITCFSCAAPVKRSEPPPQKTVVVQTQKPIQITEYNVTIQGMGRIITQVNLPSGTCFVLSRNSSDFLGFSCN